MPARCLICVSILKFLPLQHFECPLVFFPSKSLPAHKPSTNWALRGYNIATCVNRTSNLMVTPPTARLARRKPKNNGRISISWILFEETQVCTISHCLQCLNLLVGPLNLQWTMGDHIDTVSSQGGKRLLVYYEIDTFKLKQGNTIPHQVLGMI